MALTREQEQSVLGQVLDLYLYPIKTMSGASLPSVHVGLAGFEGDRIFAVRDEVTGTLKGAKRLAGLSDMKTRMIDKRTIEIELPEGRCVRTDQEDVSRMLMDAIDHPVSLISLSESTEEPERAHEDKPLPPRQTYFDSFPLMLMSQQSLDTLSDELGDDAGQVERYRPNILVDLPGDHGFPEFDLIGKTIGIGDVLIKVEMPCARCLVVGQGTRSLPRNPDIMKTMIRETEGNLGVYASVVKPGQILPSDRVFLCPDP